MLNKRKNITITLKLFSGLDKELSLKDYDMGKGMRVEVKRGMRLKKILRSIGMRKLSSNAYFMNGERIGLWKRIKDESEVSCLKPTAGG